MAKKRRNHTPEVVVTLPSPPPMRAAIPGTRSVKDLRSDAVAKLRQETKAILDSFKEVPHDHRNHKGRINPRKSESVQTPNRSVYREFELRKPDLPAKVRDSLQDRLQILACEERRARKETLFALQRTGKAGRRNKKARWTAKSYMRCK